MDSVSSRLLVLFIMVYTALGSVIVPPKSAVVFDNGPYGAWECRTAQGQVETIQTTPILQAASTLVNLWDQKLHEQWQDTSYPNRIPTNQISDWPESAEDPDDPQWLCNLNSWVGSYPIPYNQNQHELDAGPFRVLISSSYKKEGTGGDVTYVFGFCGVASHIGNEYEMCWPTEEIDDDDDGLDDLD